jgi:hypothetical protein
MFLIIPHPVPSGGGGIEPVYYVLATLTLIAAGVTAAWRFVVHQRSKWTEEGAQRTRQVQLTEENNSKLERATEAIARLTTRLEEFTVSVTRELNGLSTRVTRLEDSMGNAVHRTYESPYGGRWTVRENPKREGS